MSTFAIALDYARAGLCVLPADGQAKRPAVASWKEYQRRLPTETELRTWFATDRPLCLLTGVASGHLEMIDFDGAGEKFTWWQQLVQLQAPDLAARLVLERSPSGGWHVLYRCQSPVCGNIRLAQRSIFVANDATVELYGKHYKPRRSGERWEVVLTLIETRGEGGIFLCAPSPGYAWVQGDVSNLPVLTVEERELLLELAWSLDELQRVPEPEPTTTIAASPNGARPGDDYNARGDLRALLRAHGWRLVQGGENEHWCRPGKSAGTSATFKERVWYVFSSNAPPFEPGRAYAPFSVYALLEHGGDYSAAAAALAAQGYGQVLIPAMDVDLSFVKRPATVAEPLVSVEPQVLPFDALRIPGFVAETMDACLATAPYPNPVLAFCGAISLLALLTGRKVRDQADNRTNIYLLGLSYSSGGKDWPRKFNAQLLHQIGMAHQLGDRMASGEGIQDVLAARQAMLFQTDEFDAMLQAINKSRDGHYENLMSTLLSMYSSSNSIFPMRPKAGAKVAAAIDQPHLVIFGTAIPTHYYGALTERMLTNGFVARLMAIESGARGKGQEARPIEIPPRLLKTAKWWADYEPGGGNLCSHHPKPAVVAYTSDAQQLLIEHRVRIETEYARAEGEQDAVRTTILGRANEQARKLALLYAISRNHLSPEIDQEAVEWATRFVDHQRERLLFMALANVADNPFHADCLRFTRKLREAPGHTMSHSVLLKRMKVDAQTFQKIAQTLQIQGDIDASAVTTSGRCSISYRLLSG